MPKYQPMHIHDGEWDYDGPVFDTIEKAIDWILKEEKDFQERCNCKKTTEFEIRVIDLPKLKEFGLGLPSISAPEAERKGR